MELVWHAVDPVHLVVGELHQSVLLLLKPYVSPGPPLEPQLEDVIVTAALDHLDSNITTLQHIYSDDPRDLPYLLCHRSSRNTCLSGRGNLPTSDCSQSKDPEILAIFYWLNLYFQFVTKLNFTCSI